MTTKQNNPIDPTQCANLVEILVLRAELQPNRDAFIFIENRHQSKSTLTYAALDHQARAIAAFLQRAGAVRGDRVILLYPAGLHYITAFLGCLYAGVIAVPLYPPRRNQKRSQLAAVAADCRATIAITGVANFPIIDAFSRLDENLARMRVLCTLDVDDAPDSWLAPLIACEDIAFLQYTSGSTGVPKGVMVSHRSLMANEASISLAFATLEQDICVSWLPLYHDMGLIGTVLQSIYCGFLSVLMAPSTFARDPAIWLETISSYRASLSGGPNFAFRLAAAKVSSERLKALDLSCWRVAFNGAEPIAANTLDDFCARFKVAGFQRRSLYPCYGMAEATLFVSGGSPVLPYSQLALDKAALSLLKVLPSSDEDAAQLVCCGHAHNDHALLIVDPDSRQVLPEDQIGEIWFCGDSNSIGYWNQPDLSRATFAALLADGQGPFLRTGDMGFLHQGLLYISGRLKEMIIIRGRNFFPQDIEVSATSCHDDLADGLAAAFSVAVNDVEMLVLVAEVSRHVPHPLPCELITKAVTTAIAEDHELSLSHLVLIKPGHLPKTTSGKIRRRHARDLFLKSAFDVLNHLHAEDVNVTNTLTDYSTNDDSPTLAALKDAWSLVLEQPRPAPDANFFSCGGDSLRAMQLLGKLNECFAVQVPVDFLFENPTPEALAGYIIEQINAGAELAPISASGLCRCPLSFAQQRLWFLDQVDPGSCLFNIPVALEIRGPLDVSVLLRSLNEIVARHESLRTRFISQDEVPLQLIDPPELLSVAQHDLCHLTPSDAQNSLRALIRKDAQTPFDLAHGPLMRLSLLHLSSHRFCLLLCLHHIISDGASMAVMIDELQALYRAFALDAPCPLPPLAVQYSDYSVWQRDWLQGERLQSLIDFWSNTLDGAPALLELPYDRPRPARRSFEGSKLSCPLPADLILRLELLGELHRATLFMTLQAAFHALLSRLSNSDDIVIGSDTANRSHGHLDRMIGFFVNQLVLRADLSGDPSFSTLLGRVRSATLGAIAHQDLPFEKLVDALVSDRSLKHAPLFQVKFLLLFSPADRFCLPGLTVKLLDQETLDAQYDLTLSINFDRSFGYVAHAHYNVQLFDAASINRLLGYYQRLLVAVAQDPEQVLSLCPLLDECERTHLLNTLNLSDQDHSHHPALHLLFEAQALRRPDATAVVFNDLSMSFGDLDRRANQMAHHLMGVGVGPDVLVGLFLDRSLEMVVALMGLLKAGGAFLPLDPDYPTDRLDFMLEDSMITVLVSCEDLEEAIPAFYGLAVILDSDFTCLDAEPVTPPVLSICDENLAYTLYTSGSTGKPKGTQVPLSALANLCFWYLNFGPIVEGTNVLQVIPFSFDASIKNLLAPLIAGGRLVLFQNGAFDPHALLDTIDRQQIHVLNCVPSVFYPVVALAEQAGFRQLASLKNLALGGEATDVSKLRAWLKSDLCSCTLSNIYGPTECSDISVAFQLPAHLIEDASVMPIGLPIDNARAYVVDRHLQLVPRGVAGELLIGGVGLGDYLNQPDLSQEKFLPNPFGEGRVYRSGDLVLWSADGLLVFKGRMDHQVKIRGLRIELGEIESCLRQLPSISDAVVLVRDVAATGKKLLAFLTTPVHNPATTRQIRSQLAAVLPDYMVPTYFCFVAKFPKLPNDKVDLNRLADMFDPTLVQVRSFEAPQSPTEKTLAQVWSEVLSQERVGLHDNFFELGGDSLLSVRVVSLAQKANLILSVNNIFEFPSIHALAAHLDANPVAPAAVSFSRCAPFDLISDDLQALLPEGLDDAYPPTQLQLGMIYFSALQAESTVYHDIFSFHMVCAYDAVLFREAAQSVIDHHPVLRTTFELARFKVPLQLVHSHRVVCFKECDFRSDPERKVHDYMERLKQETLDIANGPLIRFHLCRRSEGSFQLLIDAHHAILDGWSMATLVTELLSGYLARLGLAEDKLPLAPVSGFNDLVAHELKALNSPDQEAFWDDQLVDWSHQAFPTTCPKPAEDALAQFANFRVTIPADVSSGIQALAKAKHLPLKSVLLAAHMAVLRCCYGCDDVSSGVVVHGRFEGEGGDRVLGLFLSAIPIRLRVPAGSWLDLIVALSDLERSAHEFRRFPIAERFGRRGKLLFEACFNFTNFHVYQALGGSEALQVVDVSVHEHSKMSLMATWNLDLSNLLQLVLGYDALHLDAPQIDSIAGYYNRALALICSNPEASFRFQSLLDPATLSRLLNSFNADPAAPSTVSVHKLFEQRVARDEHACAVVSLDDSLSLIDSLTYAMLNARANQLARYLEGLGVGPESRVAIAIERSPLLIIAVLATLKAAAAYVPLDPAYPTDRLRFMLADADCSVLLTQSMHVERFELLQDTLPRVLLDTDNPYQTFLATNLPSTKHHPQLPAYVIYTSGSTGLPKGVVISHQALSNYALGFGSALGIDFADKLLQFASFSFDTAVEEMFVTLLHGAMLVLRPAGQVIAFADLVRLCQLQNISILDLPTAYWHSWLADSSGQLALPAWLRLVILGGEAVAPDLLDRWLRTTPAELVLCNGYGPTETTITATSFIPKMRSFAGSAVPIGKPNSNYQVHLLDRALMLVPDHVPGELAIAGVGLARGYLGQPARTAAAFLPNPFSDQPGARLYPSGDLGQRQPDGSLVFLGRLDHQLKIRGFRIEPGEIEAVLAGLDEVAQAAVLAVTTARVQRLVAFVVATAPDHTSDVFVTALRAQLPDYMIPDSVVLLDALPLTVNGKLDRPALQHLAKEAATTEPDQAYVAPRTPTETLLADLWAQVLVIERPIGIDEHFFELGGHSLLITRLASLIRKRLRVELPLRIFFSTPTIRDLAEKLAAALDAGTALMPSANARPRPDLLPLSFAQQRLWFLDRLDPGLPVYNIPEAIRLVGALSPTLLEGAIDVVVHRHESLRTYFREQVGEVRQIIADVSSSELSLTDLSGTALKAKSIAEAFANAPFQLDSLPLFRIHLLRLGPTEHILLVNMHHIISDGWSMEVLTYEVANAYRLLSLDLPVSLPPLAMQYADYATWQRDWMLGEALELQLSYWREQLSGAPLTLDLPTKGPRPLLISFDGSKQHFALDAALTKQLRALASEGNGTLFFVLQAAFSELLGRYSGARELNVGMPVANRRHLDLEPIIGFFANTLVLRMRRGDDSVRQRIATARDTILDALCHQDLPFEKLVEALNPERDLSRMPLFQVVLVYRNQARKPFVLPAVKSTPWLMPHSVAKFDLTLVVSEVGEGLECHFEYNTALFEPYFIKGMARHFALLLHGFVLAPDTRADRLPLFLEPDQNWVLPFPEDERAQILLTFNDTVHDWPDQRLVHQIFEGQARETPHAAALIYQDLRLNYGIFNAEVNRLAHYLRSQGVGPEHVVAVCMERSLKLVIALYAILKSGGYYLPLAPEHPSARLAYMLKDSRARLMLTHDAVTAPEGTRVINLDHNEAAQASLPVHDPAPPLGLANGAYLIYTSGSTGKPKGVLNSHGGMRNRLQWMQHSFPLTTTDRVLLKTPYSFDVSVWEFFWPLMTGAALVVAEPEGHRDPAYLQAMITDHSVTTLHFVPSMLAVFLEDSQPGSMPSMRQIFSSGETLTKALAKQTLTAMPHISLHNLYGPTEAAIDVSWWPCRAEEPRTSLPIGGPIANTSIFPVDRHGALVPVGVPGELWIAGDNLARCYHDRPALTAEKYVPNAFALTEGARVFRSGDLGLLVPHQKELAIEYLGRIDYQVKLRGQRLELGEIEATLQALPEVAEACVMVRTFGPDDAQLVAYVRPAAGPAANLMAMTQKPDLMTLPDGLACFYLNRGEAEFIHREIFEERAYIRGGIALWDEAVVIDVGANIGMFSMFAHYRAQQLKLIAIEPIEHVHKILAANVALHGIQATLYQCGLAAEAGEADFTFYRHNTIISGRYADQQAEGQVVKNYLKGTEQRMSEPELEELVAERLKAEAQTCRLRRLSDIIEELQLKCIDLLKIDVEKSELDVLHGIDELHWPMIKQVVVEVHDEAGRLQTVQDLLAGHGFSLHTEKEALLGETELFNIYARRPEQRAPLASPRPLAAVTQTAVRARLTETLSRQLPEYMQPSHLLLLSSMPLTSNGKLDRRALPAHPLDRDGTLFEAPSTPLEQALAGLWQETLGIKQVGRYDHFFKLGGHSLMAVRLVTRVRATIGCELPLQMIFANPVLSELAAQIGQLKRVAAQEPLRALPRLAGKEVFQGPLSWAQERMWFNERMEPGASTYVLPLQLQLDGPLDSEHLQKAFQALLDRHYALRTRILEEDSLPIQVVDAKVKLTITIVDFQQQPDAERQSMDKLAEASAQGFDLEKGPLFRVVLFREAPSKHYLSVSMHHIVSDGWSLRIILTEMAQLYADLSAGQPLGLEPLTLQYPDFSEWQRRWFSGELFERQQAYWKAALQKAPTLALPLDYPRPAVQTYKGANYRIQIDKQTSGEFEALAQQKGVTPFMAGIAIYSLMLSRYGGSNDLVIGTPIANRNHTENMIGVFVNTLGLRFRLDETMSYAELLIMTRQITLEAFQHQDLPFEKLVEALVDKRDMSRSPLFQVLYSHETLELETVGGELKGITVTPLANETKVAKFELGVYTATTEQGLQVEFNYNTDLYSSTSIAQMASYYKQLLQASVARPEQPIKALMSTINDNAPFRERFNETDQTWPDQLCHQVFEERVTKMPLAVAIFFEDGAMVYEQFNARVNSLAHHLRRYGVGPEVQVGVQMYRSLEMVIALYSILKAGGVYVPLEPDYPATRLTFIQEDSGLELLLTHDAALPTPALETLTTINLDRKEDMHACQPEQNPETQISPAHGAYLIYTSGTTGKPKGVLNSHGGMRNRLNWMQHRYPLRATDTVLQKTPFTFDVSIWEFFWPLMAGARLGIAKPEGHREPAYLAALIQELTVTTLHFVPSMLAAFLKEVQPEALASLRQVFSSGEVLPRELAEQVLEQHPQLALHNLYGPTEAAVDVTSWRCERDETRATLPIGSPISNCRIQLVDRHGFSVPVGVPGEMLIAGDNLARGYLQRPAQTAEKFIPNCHGTGGERIYRSGDLARLVFRGPGRLTLEYLGRIDHQVKIRGQRIELSEIESELQQQPEVAEAAVMARTFGPEDTRLVAFLRPEPGPAANFLTQNETAEFITLPGGLTCYHLNRGETEFIHREIFEEETYLRGGVGIGDQAIIFDVGANIGMFSMYAHYRVRAAHVFAFEPIEQVHEVLAANTALHGMQATLFRCGLAAQAGEASFTYYRHNSILSGRFADAEAEQEVVKGYIGRGQQEQGEEIESLIAERLESEQQTCALRRLSDIINEHEVRQIDLLKIDVEKSELEVLLGIDAHHWPLIKQVVVEVHDASGRLQTISDLLTRQGFRLHLEKEEQLGETHLYNIYATRAGQEPQQASPRSLPAITPQALAHRLREALLKKMPEYMVPAHYLPLVSLPITASGKLDRRELATIRTEKICGIVADWQPPSSPLEQALADIWCTLLGLERVGLQDNFFKLGGHSLLGMQLLTRIRETLAVELSIRTLFEWPTLGEQAEWISTKGYEVSPQAGPAPLVLQANRFGLVALNQGEGRPLFLVHPGGGQVHWYLEMAEHMKQPVYGLEHPGLSDSARIEMGFAQVVDSYLQGIQEICDSGPFLIGAWSSGGPIAYELARRLSETGATVQLVLIDSIRHEHMDEHASLGAFASDFEQMQPIDSATREAVLASLNDKQGATAVFRILANSPSLLESWDLEQLFNKWLVFKNILEGACSYQPSAAFTGPILMLRALATQATLPESQRDDYGWGTLLGEQVQLVDLPGDHYQLFTGEGAQRLAGLLEQHLLE